MRKRCSSYRQIQWIIVVVVVLSTGGCLPWSSSWGMMRFSQAFSLVMLSSVTTTATIRSIIEPNNSSGKHINNNNILILDHININHEAGRHDWVLAFYGTFLNCPLDPRKIENVEKGSGTVWANIASNQFHLPEGKPSAQVLDGSITLAYPDLGVFSLHGERYKAAKEALSGSQFNVELSVDDDDDQNVDSVMVTDPWGSRIILVKGQDSIDRDNRGKQPGDRSEGIGMKELTIHVPVDANLDGIGRWYESVLGGVVVPEEVSKKSKNSPPKLQIAMGPYQFLTFVPNPKTTLDSHVDLRQEPMDSSNQQCSSDEGDERTCLSMSSMGNYGPHISIYVADLAKTYERADKIGSVYVNKRFSRQAFSLDEAVDQCMFRCLNIVDPLHPEDGPIIRLEHEVRSVTKADGTMYKSCPFDEIPK